MKHLTLIFFILILLPALAFGEQILWEDDSGQVVLNDDGGVSFLYGDSGESDNDEFFSVQTTPEPLCAPMVGCFFSITSLPTLTVLMNLTFNSGNSSSGAA